MFNVVKFFCSGSRWSANFRFDGELTLEQATYSWPWVKTWPLNQTPTNFKVCPWDLLMEIAKEILTGNCLLCHSNRYSFNFGMKVILGMRTIRPDSTIRHWRSLLSRHLSKISRVPLQSAWRGLILRRSISGIPGLRFNMCWGKPLGLRVWRYSELNLNASSGFPNVSALLDFIPDSDRDSCILLHKKFG